MTSLLNILFSPLLLKIIVFGMSGAAAFLMVYYLFPDEEQLAAQKRLGVEEERNKPHKTSLLKRFYLIYSNINDLVFAHYTPRWFLNWIDRRRPHYQHQLIVANIRDEITPDEFVAFKVWLAILIPILSFMIASVMGYSYNFFWLILMIIVGFMSGDLWLKEIIMKRKKAILRALPYTLDLLTLSVEAGMDFIAAIQRLTQRTKNNPMVEEFGHMLKEIRLGTSRADALRNLSMRLQIEEVSSFTTLLIQADQLGSSIGDVLRAQSDQLRSKRFQSAEAAGARASQMILLPLVFCIFPAVFIVVLGPTVLNMLTQGIFR